MRLISYRSNGTAGLGVMVGAERFVAVPEVAPELPHSMRELLEMGELGLAAARRATEGREPKWSTADVTVDPVIREPRAIWCLARNYKEHADEIGVDLPTRPMCFLRLPGSQTGHLQPLIRPKVSEQFDYEGELAVVIGKHGRHIPVAEATDYVAGYSCYNDGSVRDWQRHSSQITAGKNFHCSGSFGPWLVTPDEFGNASPHYLRTRLNGQVVQETSLSLMIFGVEELIAYFSTIQPLSPGDVIVTGTPGGVGLFRNPPLFMKSGDTVEVEITGVGTLINRIVDEG